MKNHSELQENNETRHYILKNKITGNVLHVLEKFFFYGKRGPVFPAQYSRTGRQLIELSEPDGTIVAVFRNVYESAAERKKSIFKFLRFKISDLKDYECFVEDKVAHLNVVADCVELVRMALPKAFEIKQYEEKEAGFVEIVFKHDISDFGAERLKKALYTKCITYRLEENKKLYIKYLS